MKNAFKKLARLILIFAFANMLASCASINPNIVDHAFEFDLRYDDQKAAVLDFRYGDSKLPVRAPKWAVREGREIYFNGVNGPMLRGDFLYVKWIDKKTGKVYEENVDLRSRLPNSIDKCTVNFMLRGPQLYVYLITPEPRSPGMPINGPRIYRNFKVLTIYPDLTKP